MQIFYMLYMFYMANPPPQPIDFIRTVISLRQNVATAANCISSAP